jgi:hypothetical protein
MVWMEMVEFTGPELAVRLTDVGERVQVLPVGAPEQRRLTDPLKESMGDVLMVKLLRLPRVLNSTPPPALLLTTKSAEAVSAGLVEPE